VTTGGGGGGAITGGVEAGGAVAAGAAAWGAGFCALRLSSRVSGLPAGFSLSLAGVDPVFGAAPDSPPSALPASSPRPDLLRFSLFASPCSDEDFVSAVFSSLVREALSSFGAV
jgi:hypothetical protein